MWLKISKGIGASALSLAVAGLVATAAQGQQRDQIDTPDAAGKSFEDREDFLKYYNEVWDDWQYERNQDVDRESPPSRYKTDDTPDPTVWRSGDYDPAEIRAMEYERRIRDRELRDPDMRTSEGYRDRYLGSVMYWTEANNYWTGPVREPNEDKIAEAEEQANRIGKGPADTAPAQTDLDDYGNLDRKWRQSDYQWRLTDYYWADPELREDPGYEKYWQMSDRYWADSDAYWYYSNVHRGVELPEGEQDYIASRTNQGKGFRPQETQER